MQKVKTIQPILKWAGGKRQLMNIIKKRIPDDVKRYYEPFLGGGAILFNYLPAKATINDINSELINMYKIIKEYPNELIRELNIHKTNHCEDYFYEIRNYDRNEEIYLGLSEIQRAARTIYLNRTCYNGLFRVSKQGYFNTPIGKYINPVIVNETVIYQISDYFNLNDINILCGDYHSSLRGSRRGDFVYLDPPYYPISKTSSFTGYTNIGFGEDEQIRLKKQCDNLDKKGVRFLLSNSNCSYIRKLYDGYKIEVITARRAINSKGDNRINSSELLISNY